MGLAVDAAGNAYVTGTLFEGKYPFTAGSPDGATSYLTKLDPAGAHAIFSIPIGGGEEYAVEALCRHILATLRADGPIVENAEAPRITEIWRSMCDNSDAKRLLRWSPRIDLGEGLRRTLTAEAIYLAAQPGRVSVAEVQE